ncbi:tetratricopeptide repeat protein [Dyella jiangningensis]|uniref:Cellulose synthase operon C C-terminal domain-containing protein n=1 Tax=Dyella jiangningensis TaxID=1379159 RepID=A0A328NYZ8_9GAMM|nr:tetratricopeptide repeat protein [Dyella jiangningensis]RAO75310.1 hypothetical protein CA260_14595 [Dyella jiangningensis]
MNRRLPLLALLLLPAAHAQTASIASDIQAGRAALSDNQPARARSLFAAALAQDGGSHDDRYAAAMGLGQSTLWLGQYPAAADAFRIAQQEAAGTPARQAADTGLAQALNAQDYPRAAYALVAPFAMGQTRPTVELMRATQSLGWEDRGESYLDAAPAPTTQGYLATQYRLLGDDIRLALSSQLQGDFAYSHDSDGLDTWHVGGAYRFAPSGHDGWTQRWGIAAGTTHVEDDLQSRRLDDLSLLGELHLGDDNRIDLDLGPGRSGSWNYLQGSARWTLQPSDSFSLSTGAERAPVPTDTAIADRLIYDVYSVGVSLRPASRWYVVPTYYRQDFSDGNHRDGGTMKVLLSPYDIPDTGGAIGAEFSARIFHSSQPSHGVYFNPANYRTAQVGLVGVYSLSQEWKVRGVAAVGRQVTDGAGASVYTIGASLSGRLPGNGRLELQLGRSSAASANGGGSGYWCNSINLSVRYPL